MKAKEACTVLIVDDDQYVLKSTANFLYEQNYNVIPCGSAIEAERCINGQLVDIVLTDIRMPEISGLDLLQKVHKSKPQLPVILMTGYADLNTAVDAIKKGAFDFIVKPLYPEYLNNSINKAVEHNNFLKLKNQYRLYLEDMVDKRSKELIQARHEAEDFGKDIVERLTTVAEFRDMESGVHAARMGVFSELIAEHLGMPADYINSLKQASPLHDIGKIGISDYILFKLGPLTSEEYETIKTHTTQGQRILHGSSHPELKMAESIAHNHHERWDGTGYPRGLKGDNIPMEGRIVMIADQYDALRSARPYKSALNHEEVCNIITKGDGRTMPEHFAPEILDAFICLASKFDTVFSELSKY